MGARLQSRPPIFNRLLAHFGELASSLGAFGFIGFLAWGMNREGLLFFEKELLGWYSVSTVLAGAIGWIAGGLLIVQVFGVLVLRAQGGPFKRGDRVRVLAGKELGAICTVSSVWELHGLLYFDSSESGNPNNSFSLGSFQVCRVRRESAN